MITIEDKHNQITIPKSVYIWESRWVIGLYWTVYFSLMTYYLMKAKESEQRWHRSSKNVKRGIVDKPFQKMAII